MGFDSCFLPFYCLLDRFDQIFISFCIPWKSPLLRRIWLLFLLSYVECWLSRFSSIFLPCIVLSIDFSAWYFACFFIIPWSDLAKSFFRNFWCYSSICKYQFVFLFCFCFDSRWIILCMFLWFTSHVLAFLIYLLSFILAGICFIDLAWVLFFCLYRVAFCWSIVYVLLCCCGLLLDWRFVLLMSLFLSLFLFLALCLGLKFYLLRHFAGFRFLWF